jgi:hypothetical protein
VPAIGLVGVPRAGDGASPSHKPRRVGPAVVVVLAVVVALLVVDRVGKLLAARALAGNIASNEHLDHRPHVTIRGFPFLTQLISGSYRDIDISSSRPIGADGVDVSRPTVRLHGVKVGVGDALHGTVKDVPVRSGTGTALLTYPQLTTIVHRYAGTLGSLVTLSSGGGDVAKVNGPLGLTVRVTGQVVNGRLLVTADQGDLDQLPNSLKADAQRLVATPIPLPTFPFNVRLASGHITDQGVLLTATAHDSVFPTRTS